ncbi:hypothetical protein [Pseudomonas helleri]|uniref:hypothetical protein n=1 Tax=Pseudomonas helleri TaxID=1608996 RepID=UPI002432F102|nr:hypothetical protein [Pseudomonas helleri]
MTFKISDDAVSFDLLVAKKLQSKMNQCKDRNIEFGLTFTCMKNLMKAKRCFYTGIPLTYPKSNPIKGDKTLPSDITIDRVDSSKGYVKGNVVACCNGANNLKSLMEGDGLGTFGYVMGRRVFDKAIKHIEKAASKNVQS